MKKTKAKHLLLNTVMPFVLEVVTIASGLIVPRLLLGSFGSEVNGLVSSITQFLAIITFFEAGIGSVVRYNLYKPLAEQDNVQLSKVVVSANKFFRLLAWILLGYVVVLMAIYPLIAAKEFGHMYTAILIAVMCVSSFSRYYFGQVNQLLLTADQKGYIQYTAQIVTIILNVTATAVLIKLGAGIHFVKLSTSLIHLLRPLFLQWYVKRHYSINYKITYTEEPIKQKWNGLAQHIASVVLDHTDVIVLTVLSTLSNVSIYHSYHLVVNGIKKLLHTSTSGIQSRMGELIAREDRDQLQSTFSKMEWTIHTTSSFLFGTTCVLIVPFIMVYTKGITDANYNVPLFGLLITMANAGHSLRLPYSITVLSGGHYKQTQSNYIIAAVMNIVVSVVLVFFYGLVGVAIGTLVAMLYQTVWMAYYCYKNVIHRNIMLFWKQMLVDALSYTGSVLLFVFSDIHAENYWQWIMQALKFTGIELLWVGALNLIFYRKQLTLFVKMIVRRLTKKRRKIQNTDPGDR